MKKIGLLMCAALLGMFVISCGSSKKTAAPKDEHCCLSTPDAFRAEGSFLAQYESMEPKAKSNAANNARQELATMMEATISRVIENYASTYNDGDAQDFKESVKELSRSVVKQTIKNSVPAIPGWSEKREKGTMFYVCLEADPNALLNGIKEKVSNDAKLRTDFEYEKFKQIFEKEMENLQ